MKKRLLFWALHGTSVSPLVLTMAFVTIHFRQYLLAGVLFGVFVVSTLLLSPVLKKAATFGKCERIETEHVAFVDKDPGRMLPMYVLPFVVFANAKTEDLGLLVFLFSVIGYIMNGPLSLQTHPAFWILKWRIYHVTVLIRGNGPQSQPTKMSLYILTKKRIRDMTGTMEVRRLSPAFYVDKTL